MYTKPLVVKEIGRKQATIPIGKSQHFLIAWNSLQFTKRFSVIFQKEKVSAKPGKKYLRVKSVKLKIND